MTPPKIKPDAGHPAVEAVLAAAATSAAAEDSAGSAVSADTIALATRYLLQRFGADFPGFAVEVRVPPYGAVQAVEGPKHTRGTPPNVVELAPTDWVALATGQVSWESLVNVGRVSASGTRSNLSDLLPLAEW